MALRDERGAGRGGAARGRARFVGGALALYGLAALTAAWPALDAVRTRFLAGGAPGHGEAAAGDHLQTLYHLWLVGHQLAHGAAPWLDPYSFRPEGGTVWNPAGWPFGLPFWPLAALFGPVLAWNLFILLSHVAAGALTCSWLRALELPRGAALAGGLAFALAPYRVNQSAGHLLGPISVLLPLALFGIERARRGSAWWLALGGAALASIPLSGQVHLALGAIPLFAAYAAVRLRGRLRLAGAAAAVGTAILAGILIQRGVIAGSASAGGRPLAEVGVYSAHWQDFLVRHKRHGPESFVFLGWATPVLAIAGLAGLLRTRRYALAALLGLAAAIPILLAFGTNLPLYAPLWHALPPFRYPRVPERLMPIADLAIAALVAFLVAWLPRRAWVGALVLALLLVDLHVRVYGRSEADPANAAYAAVRATPRGRLVELPVFPPDLHYGSVYLYYDLQARRERPFGYSTTAPKAAVLRALELAPINCGDWSRGAGALLRRLDVTAITLHFGLFVHNRVVPDRAWFAARGLVAHGWAVTATSGAVWSFTRGRGTPVASRGSPHRGRAYFCQGWDGDALAGRRGSFWVYGRSVRYSTGGRVARRRFATRGWHLVTVEGTPGAVVTAIRAQP